MQSRRNDALVMLRGLARGLKLQRGYQAFGTRFLFVEEKVNLMLFDNRFRLLIMRSRTGEACPLNALVILLANLV